MKKFKIKVETPNGTYIGKTEYEEGTEEALLTRYLVTVARGEVSHFIMILASGQRIILGKDVITNSVFSLIEVE